MRIRLWAIIACLALASGCHTVPQPVQAAAVTTARDTSWVARSALYEVFVQDFSSRGDFRGVIDGLDRIQSAGADVVWLMPIHPIGVTNRKGVLGSPYAARDYRAIDPAYGTAADFRALVQAVHARGMKLILDWVPDHTAMDHPWVREHPDFYFLNEHGEPTPPRDPEGNLTDWTDVAQLDYGNPALRREMIATMRWWLEEFGLDGFRVDVAGFIPYDFWREALPALRAAVPRRLLFLAEWGDPELTRIGYDLIYAWDSHVRLKAVWGGASAATIVPPEVADRAAMPSGGMRMRFTTNHDMTAWDDPPLALFGGPAGARAAFVAMALLPGRPLVYNGQEVESPQKLGLFERQVIDWNQPHAAQARAFYRQILRLARTDPALTSGDLEVVETSAPDDVIAYQRDNLVVLVNPRSHPVQATVSGADLDRARELLSGRTQRGNTVAFPAYGAMVFRRQGQ
jgi:glycosidase